MQLHARALGDGALGSAGALELDAIALGHQVVERVQGRDAELHALTLGCLGKGLVCVLRYQNIPHHTARPYLVV